MVQSGDVLCLLPQQLGATFTDEHVSSKRVLRGQSLGLLQFGCAGAVRLPATCCAVSGELAVDRESFRFTCKQMT